MPESSKCVERSNGTKYWYLNGKQVTEEEVIGTNKTNPVDHPTHYNSGSIEVIDAIEDWKLDFSLGNVVKYVARSPHKGNQLEDLKKAQWYLNREVSKLGK